MARPKVILGQPDRDVWLLARQELPSSAQQIKSLKIGYKRFNLSSTRRFLAINNGVETYEVSLEDCLQSVKNQYLDWIGIKYWNEFLELHQINPTDNN